MLVELVVLYSIQHREFRDVIGNLLVLLIGGIPIAMPRVLSTTMVIGSRTLSRPEVIIKRMSAIEKMAGMGVLCCNKTWTLNLKKLTVDQDLIEVFANDFAKKHVLLFAARASRTENQDAIDAAIIGTLADPKEILTLCDCKEDLKKKVHSIIYKFACQVVPEKSKDSAGGPWQFVGLLPLIHPPRHDSAEAIRKALNIGAQLSIIKDIGQKLGVGTNMHSFAIFHSED